MPGNGNNQAGTQTALVTTPLPNRNYQPGSYDLGQRVIPAGYSFISIDVDRTDWLDPAIHVACSLDLSLDNGATWINGWLGFTAVGGPLQPPSPLPGGIDPNHTIVSTGIDGDPQASRVVRGTLTISGQAVKISATVTLT